MVVSSILVNSILIVSLLDISWQTSLASAAVAAAEDVRSAVRIHRTAANAKAAASSASMIAQNACANGDFNTMDEARAAQTRASIARSHAIHAAVVEHEAKTVKRRATLALANDVKCWNVHRKRDLLRSCFAYARSQHEATRRAVDAWGALRDGFIDTAIIPSASVHDRRSHAFIPAAPVPPPQSSRLDRLMSDSDEIQGTIFDEDLLSRSPENNPVIVAVDHCMLTAVVGTRMPQETVQIVEATEDIETREVAAIVPNDEASVHPHTEDEATMSYDYDIANTITNSTTSKDEYKSTEHFGIEDLLGEDLIMPFATADPILEEEEDLARSQATIEDHFTRNATSGEILSASMQSLVDGLMTWGGGFHAEEDYFNLPHGMATSIVLEESRAMETHSHT
jgi:hypothetical protein